MENINTFENSENKVLIGKADKLAEWIKADEDTDVVEATYGYLNASKYIKVVTDRLAEISIGATS